MFSVISSTTIKDSWQSLPSIIVGRTSQSYQNPNSYILISDNNDPVFRVDLHSNSDESYAFHDSIIKFDHLFIGWGDALYVINLKNRSLCQLNLGSYFGGIHIHSDSLFITSGERLFSISDNGKLIWRSDVIGIDGVVIEKIEADLIFGSGEWDPPGGWQPFCIDLKTGYTVTQ